MKLGICDTNYLSAIDISKSKDSWAPLPCLVHIASATVEMVPAAFLLLQESQHSGVS